MPKLTLEQKRRETLRRQLYGREDTAFKTPKNSTIKSSAQPAANVKTYSLSDYQPSTPNSELLTSNYLTHDLSKVLIFSVLAIGAQFILFFLLQHNLVKLAF